MSSKLFSQQYFENAFLFSLLWSLFYLHFSRHSAAKMFYRFYKTFSSRKNSTIFFKTDSFWKNSMIYNLFSILGHFNIFAVFDSILQNLFYHNYVPIAALHLSTLFSQRKSLVSCLMNQQRVGFLKFPKF